MFKFDIEKDIYRYYYTASKIAQGLYGNKYFYVLPTLDGLSRQVIANSIYFPKNDLIAKNEWDILKKTELSTSPEVIKSFESYDKVKLYLTEHYTISDEVVNKIEMDWNKVEPFFDKISRKLTTDYPEYTDIRIYITRLGSVSSFVTKANGCLDLYFRVGSDLSNLAELLLASTVIKHTRLISKSARLQYGQGVDWLITESIVDYLMLHTDLRTIFPEFLATIEGTNFSSHPEIAKKSIKYLKEIGFGPQDSLLLENDEIKSSNGEIIKGLNNQEFKILKLLIENKNKVCTYEDMAKTLWEDDYLERFSMYALNKIIFQVRHKLKMNKAHNVSIKTKRNSGYVLFF